MGNPMEGSVCVHFPPFLGYWRSTGRFPYRSHFFPISAYGSPGWDPCSQTHANFLLCIVTDTAGGSWFNFFMLQKSAGWWGGGVSPWGGSILMANYNCLEPLDVAQLMTFLCNRFSCSCKELFAFFLSINSPCKFSYISRFSLLLSFLTCVLGPALFQFRHMGPMTIVIPAEISTFLSILCKIAEISAFLQGVFIQCHILNVPFSVTKPHVGLRCPFRQP